MPSAERKNSTSSNGSKNNGVQKAKGKGAKTPWSSVSCKNAIFEDEQIMVSHMQKLVPQTIVLSESQYNALEKSG